MKHNVTGNHEREQVCTDSNRIETPKLREANTTMALTIADRFGWLG